MKAPLTVLLILTTLALVSIRPACGQETGFYLKNNDRVVFYGDSITEQAFYTNFVETYVVTRFPSLKVDFINSGWSGDKIWGGDGGTLEVRLRRDVFAHKPTVLTAMLGMNDGCYEEFDPKCFTPFTEFYHQFVDSVKKNGRGLRLTLLQPSPFDDWTDSNEWRLPPPVKSGYNKVIVRYGLFVKELAEKNRLDVVDMNGPVVDVIAKAQKAEGSLAMKIIPDRIHPGTAGALVMAQVLLESWKAPSLVSSVGFDAAAKKVVSEENTKISAVKFDTTLSWTQVDGALPMAIDSSDKALMLTASLTHFANTLNRQLLSVKGLGAAHYDLMIDGVKIIGFTRDELAVGVDLSVLPTPMMKQAMEVHDLTQQHNKVHFTAWREVQIPFAGTDPANAGKAIGDLDALEADLVRRQRRTAQPRPHRFELIPQK